MMVLDELMRMNHYYLTESTVDFSFIERFPFFTRLEEINIPLGFHIDIEGGTPTTPANS